MIAAIFIVASWGKCMTERGRHGVAVEHLARKQQPHHFDIAYPPSATIPGVPISLRIGAAVGECEKLLHGPEAKHSTIPLH